jgi:hypothetical protein
VDCVVVERVCRIVGEAEPGIAAQDIEEVLLVPEVEDEAAAAQRQPGGGSAALGRRLLESDVQLDAHSGTEEVAQSSAATDLFVEVEYLVIAGVRPERAQFELMGVLGGAKGRSNQ